MEHRAAEAEATASRYRLQPFDYQGVSLKPGMFSRQFETIKQYLLSLPDDGVLKGFRERAGQPSPGKALGGWYSAGMPLPAMFEAHPTTLCNSFGQWLGALARMYRASGEERLRVKASYLLAEWAKTIEADGYFFYGAEPAILHYDFDKTLGGLVDVYQYLEIAEALRYAEIITRWAERNLERRRMVATPDYESGGGWVGGSEADAEWYTLPENLYRLYLITGESRHLEFARTWHYDRYWSRLASRDAAAMTGLHAYSHVNTLNSAAMAYAVTGQVEFRQAVEGAYEILRHSQLLATGGYGPGERLAADRTGLAESLRVQKNTFEVSCGTWAAFKMVRYLQAFTGKAHYGDWAETLLYNAIGAALPPGPGGRTYYYADYRITGGSKAYYLDARFPPGPEGDFTPFPCCSGTYPLAITDYHNLIYYHDPHSLFVNLFVPSTAKVTFRQVPVVVELDTDYPNTGSVTLTVNPSRPVGFVLKIRIPAWVSGAVVVKVNQSAVPATCVPGEWAAVERDWRSGDTVELALPLGMRRESLATHNATFTALLFGPVALAANRAVHFRKKPRLQRIASGGLLFSTVDATSGAQFKPLFSFGEGEAYYLYHLQDDKPE